MGIFGSIMNKIFHHGQAQAAPAQAPAQTHAPAQTQAQAPAPAAQQAPAQAAAPAPAPQSVDVGAVLSEMASMKDGGGNYQTSIVDLLKLLDLDSSLSARKELANELNVHVAADGSAEENIALNKAVMAKLAENGGVVPDSLRN
jgi:3-oxoacyl-ACP reductase-like protein